jgi:hypothetical protein
LRASCRPPRRASGGAGGARGRLRERGLTRWACAVFTPAFEERWFHPALAANSAMLLRVSPSRSERRGPSHSPDSGGADDGSERKQRLVPEAME